MERLAPGLDVSSPTSRLQADDPRTRFAVSVLLVLSACLLTTFAGWPYWHNHPLPAFAVLVSESVLVALGWTLVNSQRSPRTGILLIMAAFAYAVSWASSRDVSIWPAVGEMGVGVFFLFLGWGILLNGEQRLPTFWSQAWLAQAVISLFGTNILYMGLSQPEQLGYSGEGVVWPHFWQASPDMVDLILRLSALSYGILGITFLMVLLDNSRRMHWLSRRLSWPIIIVCGLFAIAAAALQYPTMMVGVTLEEVLAGRSYQGATAVAVPLAFFGSQVRTQWETQTAAARLIKAIGLATPTSVQAALRQFMRDPHLRIYLWLPAIEAFVDPDGQVMLQESTDPEEQSATAPLGTQRIEDPGGQLLAICELSDQAEIHERFVRAALDACVPALQAARLQVEARERVRDEQRRILDAELRGREALARDLHDGVQQSLAAVRIDLNRLGRLSADEVVRRQAQESSEHVLQAIERLRQITRGLHPPALVDRGLAGALEEDAERLGAKVRLEITDSPMDPSIQLVLYYFLSESLNNAEKYSEAERIWVTVQRQEGFFVATVEDDGKGGAQLTLGGGLYNARDRVLSVRGSFQIESPVGAGTRVGVRIPMERPMFT
jgi:signal transduction histidine kinase